MTIISFLWCLGLALSAALGMYGVTRHLNGGRSIHAAMGMFGIVMAIVCLIAVLAMVMPKH